MTYADLIALDPQAAAYVRELAEVGVAGALAARGDTDPAATLALVRRAVAAHLPRIA